MGKPFVAYLFDDPAYQFPAGVYRDHSRYWERRWIKASKVVITPNETLADDIQQRHPGVELSLVRNPTAGEPPPAAGWRVPRASGRPVRIVYTGSVYHAQGTAFQNLIAAMNRTPGAYRLEVYTSQSLSALEANGVIGPDVVRRDHVDAHRALEVQRDADVLFLPLAFRTAIPEVIRSSAPGKLGEYLASGVPILVHAPRDSFVARFSKANDAAVVADEDSVDRVALALAEVSEEEAVRRRVSDRAWRTSAEFACANSRQALSRALNAAVGGGK